MWLKSGLPTRISSRHRATEQSHHQYRAEQARARDQVQHEAGQLDEADHERIARRPAELGHRLLRYGQLEQLWRDRSTKHEESEKPSQDASGPQHCGRGHSSLL